MGRGQTKVQSARWRRRFAGAIQVPDLLLGMLQFRFTRAFTVAGTGLVLAILALSAFARTHKKTLDDLTVSVPSFSISVRLSPLAQQKLESMHEGVLVIAYFDGDALPGQGQSNAPFRSVFLGGDQKLVNEQNVAVFDGTKISQSSWNRLADKDYFVTINVVSARKASKNNLLWCSFPEERVSSFEGKSREVSCRLITEEALSNRSIEGSAVKALGSSPK